jgi:uncharacterized protein YuzE
METTMTRFFFQCVITTDDATGELLAVYFHIRKGKVHETHEFARGNVFADYDKRGLLLGIEMLGPCNVSIVDKLARNESADIRRRTKRFMRDNGPRKMVAA